MDWQRQAARDLAEGRFDNAVAADDRHGGITWTADGEAARAALVALVARWTADTLADPNRLLKSSCVKPKIRGLGMDFQYPRPKPGVSPIPETRLSDLQG